MEKGAALAVAVGVAVGLSRTIDRLLSPTLLAIRAVPSLAWVPLLVLWWMSWTRRAWTGAHHVPARDRPGVWIALFVVVMVVFGVLRNLSFGSWLAP